MAAHDSILAARVKQTRDANRKRQTSPFQKGDFVYLSTKNITFPKGLARKLIPKYIGPYKLLDDFKNQSFRVDLPPHLKQRGVHDIFHSSLLRVHVPNDDRLFPGRMDTQLGVGPEYDNEWAVDKIIDHSGSKEESIFEILWKAGDISWLPYYQIQHLQALDAYLDLMGVETISKLPHGKGKPPRTDAQVFLGASLLTNPTPFRHFLSEFQIFSTHIKTSTLSLLNFIVPCFAFSAEPELDDTSLLTPDIDTRLPSELADITPLFYLDTFFEKPDPAIMPQEPKGIRHPNFDRVSDTQYLVKGLGPLKSRALIHVGQVHTYLLFDKYLRDHNGDPSGFMGVPFGYTAFADLYNGAPNAPGE